MDKRQIMKPEDRYRWLLAWMEKSRHVDVLDSDFVDAYVEATGAKVRLCAWGAHKCKMLGRDLAYMAKCGALKRWRLGLSGSGNWQPGFPRWVFSYEVGSAAYRFRNKEDV